MSASSELLTNGQQSRQPMLADVAGFNPDINIVVTLSMESQIDLTPIDSEQSGVH